MTTLEKAIAFALKIHANQKDKAGLDYILHVLRVMNKVDDYAAKIISVLHDTIEDSGDALACLDAIKQEVGLSDDAISVLICLTRGLGEDYNDYIVRIASNPMAVQIKLADLEDNMNIMRLKNLSEKDVNRLNKYMRAYRTLRGN